MHLFGWVTTSLAPVHRTAARGPIAAVLKSAHRPHVGASIFYRRRQRVNNDVEALAGLRRYEITREEIVLLFAYLKRVLAAFISFTQPLLAYYVWNIEYVKFVGRTRLIDQRTHPTANTYRVCREVQNDRSALP